MLSFKSAIACIFILAGGFGLATARLSLINPLGAIHQDPSAPLGVPVLLGEAILLICTYLLLIAIGIWQGVSVRRGREVL